MGLFYKLLGLTSSISQRLSRMRINFVPINLALGIGLTALAIVCFSMVVESLTNTQKPVASTIADVFAGKNPQKFVTLSGDIIPDARLEKVVRRKDGSSERTTAIYTLLIDKATKQGIFVQTNADDFIGAQPHAFTSKGMVEAPPEDLVREIESISGESGLKIDPAHLLVHGAAPASAGTAIAFFALTGLGTLLFWVSYAQRYVVFRPEREVVSLTASYGGKPTDMIVLGTGQFTLDTGAKQRFLAVPCVTVELETGDAGFVCNVNASSSFMGITTTKRDGYWIMAVRRDGGPKFVRGTHYVGLRALPAVKVSFDDALAGGRQTGILAFQSEADRETMVGYLSSRGVPAPLYPAHAAPPQYVPGPGGAKTVDFDV